MTIQIGNLLKPMTAFTCALFSAGSVLGASFSANPMEANPRMFPGANVKGARVLADYLLSAKAQDFLLSFGTNRPGGMPQFYPVNRP